MRKISFIILLFALSAFVIPSAGFGEEKEVIKLDDITVKGEAMPYSGIPGTVNIVGSEQFEDLRLDRPIDILEEVPGIEVGNYNMGGVANVFSIRGFGGAGHGGDGAIYIDGIPLNEGESHADGYADMNVLIPLEIERLEVYKGPSSALFGNFARGGTLSFHTKKGGTYSQIKTEYGSYDTIDVQGAFGNTFGSSLYNNTAFQIYRTDGYQDNQAWLKGNFSTRFSYDFTENLDASLSFRFHESDWDAPGYIPKEQFDDEDRARSQAVNAEDDGGEKEFGTQRLDLGYSFSDNFRLLFWTYATQQDFTRFAKFGYDPGEQTERNYDRKVYGTGTSLNFDTQLASFPIVGVFGAEYYHEDTDWDRWDTSNRIRTVHTQHRRFNIKTVSLFGETNMELSRYFRPHLGLRYDDFGGDYENRDPAKTGFDHDMQNYDHLSPKIGFRSQILESLDFRASYSEGFALPDGDAKYDSAINVDPVKVKQYEAGLTFTPVDKVWVDLAGFIMDTDNEIQKYGSEEYRNVGETRRTGMELAVKFRPVKGLEIFGDISLIDTEIRKNSDSSLEGKELTGIPKNIFNIGLKYTSPVGLGTRIKWRNVGEYYLDDENTTKYDGYDVVDAGIFYDISDEKGTKYRLFFNVDNLFDEHYSQAVWSSGYRKNNYAVSWPRTFWAGVKIDW
ncbi:MAG: TonB-dependent receptor [Deltaproteobacteria bacterium]|nr:TonB-dependent receptor [Deltaproteobacteria bacterium]